MKHSGNSSECWLTIDPILVEKFKRLPKGITEVGTKIIRDIGLRYNHDKTKGTLSIIGPDPEILSLAVETLRFWVDEDEYPLTGITCQVGYPNKGIIIWRFHGDYGKKFEHLFEEELTKLRKIPTVTIRAVPNKQNSEYVEVYCSFHQYKRVKEEVMKITSELVRMVQDDFFLPATEYQKAKQFIRSKVKDKEILFALKEYPHTNQIRVWIFSRNDKCVIRAKKEWVDHVGITARDFEYVTQKVKDKKHLTGEYDVNTATYYGHNSAISGDRTKTSHIPSLFTADTKLRSGIERISRFKSVASSQQNEPITVPAFDNPNFPRPPNMLHKPRKGSSRTKTDVSSSISGDQGQGYKLPIGNTIGSSTSDRWTTETVVAKRKKPSFHEPPHGMYMHQVSHVGGKRSLSKTKSNFEIVSHPDTNIVSQGWNKGGVHDKTMSSVTDPKWTPRSYDSQLEPRKILKTESSVQMVPQQRKPPKVNVRYCISLNGLEIYMYKSSVVKLDDVDAIVNVVSQDMQHGGYTAISVFETAGKKPIDEMRIHLHINGPLKVGENFVTSAGRLPCLGIIHVAAPMWSDYSKEDDCSKDLHTAVYHTLKTAEKHKYRKIGLPIISAEPFFNVPKDVVAEVYVKALVDYSFAMGPLYPVLEIHLIDTNVDMLRGIKNAYEQWASSSQFADMTAQYEKVTEIPNPMKELSQRTQSAVSLKVVPQHKSQTIVTYVEQRFTSTGGQQWVFDILKKLTVHVYTGSILNVENMGAIVCAIDPNLKGSLAKSIRLHAGKKYEKSLRLSLGDRTLVEGEVIASEAGNLGAKYVLHSVISQPIRRASQKNLSRFDSVYTQTLYQANILGVRTMAMPLIGTGRLREQFEIEQCSVQLIDNIIELILSVGADLRLKDIYLINANSVMTQHLCQALRARAHTKLRVENVLHTPTRQEMLSRNDGYHMLPDKHAGYRMSPDKYVTRPIEQYPSRKRKVDFEGRKPLGLRSTKAKKPQVAPASRVSSQTEKPEKTQWNRDTRIYGSDKSSDRGKFQLDKNKTESYDGNRSVEQIGTVTNETQRTGRKKTDVGASPMRDGEKNVRYPVDMTEKPQEATSIYNRQKVNNWVQVRDGEIPPDVDSGKPGKKRVIKATVRSTSEERPPADSYNGRYKYKQMTEQRRRMGEAQHSRSTEESMGLGDKRPQRNTNGYLKAERQIAPKKGVLHAYTDSSKTVSETSRDSSLLSTTASKLSRKRSSNTQISKQTLTSLQELKTPTLDTGKSNVSHNGEMAVNSARSAPVDRKLTLNIETHERQVTSGKVSKKDKTGGQTARLKQEKVKLDGYLETLDNYLDKFARQDDGGEVPETSVRKGKGKETAVNTKIDQKGMQQVTAPLGPYNVTLQVES